ncbi:hypothetical protein [Spongiimicrobium sp. 3-5]|uniref:hypothetical protein n=1 Tax=Spongiimicrobium sp. 3-5 TaxID=3332596 RepID=UPI00397EC978
MTERKILKIPLRISIAVLVLGILLKIQQLSSNANAIIITALASIAILYTLRFWKKNKKGFLDYIKLILVVFWCANVVFSVLHLPYETFFETITFITFLIWTVMEGTAYFGLKEGNKNIDLNQILWNGVMVAGSLSIVAGIICRILYWEYATPLLLLGFFLIASYILRDTFSELLGEKN